MALTALDPPLHFRHPLDAPVVLLGSLTIVDDVDVQAPRRELGNLIQACKWETLLVARSCNLGVGKPPCGNATLPPGKLGAILGALNPTGQKGAENQGLKGQGTTSSLRK